MTGRALEEDGVKKASPAVDLGTDADAEGGERSMGFEGDPLDRQMNPPEWSNDAAAPAAGVTSGAFTARRIADAISGLLHVARFIASGCASRAPTSMTSLYCTISQHYSEKGGYKGSERAHENALDP